ncbi:MAG TPA: CvpA family protein [Candidatus Limnocylindrales bacterium]|nr:CvpA family protein [Candidatus Limnocylindrales bacterium]
MDISQFLGSLGVFDLLVILFLFAMFVLGFAQGTIRRLLGLASIVFSFLLASQLRDPVGGFLATNWTQLPKEYDVMFGYLVVFVAASVAFSVVIQGFYRKQPLFEKYTVVDELIGGLLGIVQAVVILAAVIVILDSFYRIPGIAPDNDELKVLRDVFNAYNDSRTATVFREAIIPASFAVIGGLVPGDVRSFFGG